MSLEGFSKRGMELGNDLEGIRDTKNATDSTHIEYLNSIKRLALIKIKNNIMFEGQLRAVLQRLNSLGLNITRESVLKDIQAEINKQQIEYNFNTNFSIGSSSVEKDNFEQTLANDDTTQLVSQLKNNLESIFDGQSTQPINELEVKAESMHDFKESQQDFDEIYDLEIKRLSELKRTNNPNYERELAIVVKNLSDLTTKITNFREQIESDIEYELAKELKGGEQVQVNEEMKQAQKELAEKLAWAKKQPNEPTYYKQESSSSIEFPSNMYIEDSKTMEYINSKYGNLGKATKILSVSGYPDKTYEVKFEDGKIHQITITKAEEIGLQQPQQVVKSVEPANTSSPINQVSDLEQQKKGIVENILKAMVDAGEFSYIPIEEMGKRLDAIQYARAQLESKTIDELMILLSTYSNNYEKESRGMRK